MAYISIQNIFLNKWIHPLIYTCILKYFCEKSLYLKKLEQNFGLWNIY